MTEKEIFANNLNRYMARIGKTQADLIADLGINKSTISTWCAGKKMPRMGAIQLLADYFGVKKSELIDPPAEVKDPYAGYTPANPEEEKLLEYYRMLDPENKAHLMDHINDKPEKAIDLSAYDLSDAQIKLINLLVSLNPDEARRARDFVAGMLAARPNDYTPRR
jgi:transcriptional regulator with XRE-family HTH domain